MKDWNKLGKNQQQVVRDLLKNDRWFPGCGWIWDNCSTTTKILTSLERAGWVGRRKHEPANFFRLSEAAREELASLGSFAKGVA
jgi:hypothetical protein